MSKGKKKIQTSEPDYSLPCFNDPALLREWMNVLGVTQSDLAREAGVSQSFISALERGAEKFSEPSRTKIWRAISRLNDERPSLQREVGQLISDGLRSAGLLKTPMQLKDEEIELLKQERDLATQQRDTLQQLVDINLLDRCIELEKKLADAHQQIADFHRLFALKGATVAGDELQQKIEERTKKGEP